MASKAKIKKIGDGAHVNHKACIYPLDADTADVVDAELSVEERDHPVDSEKPKSYES